MSVLPVELDGVVSDGVDILQFGVLHRDELLPGPMPLTHSAGAPSAKVRFCVLSHVAVIPGDPYDAPSFDVVDFGRIL